MFRSRPSFLPAPLVHAPRYPSHLQASGTGQVNRAFEAVLASSLSAAMIMEDQNASEKTRRRPGGPPHQQDKTGCRWCYPCGGPKRGI